MSALLPIPSGDDFADELEQALQRETYERVGLVAHALGLRRSENPYVCAAGVAFIDLAEAERMRALAEHWWRGWDSWGAGRPRSG